MKNYRKSFYRGVDSFKTGKVIFLLLQTTLVLLTQYNYSVAFCILLIVSSSYFVIHKFHNDKLINKHKAIITAHHEYRINIHNIVIILYCLFSGILSLLVLFKPNESFIWWWIGSVTICIYSESVTLSSLVAFGDDGFVSGDYYVNYCDLDEIREEKSINSLAGEIVLITLWKDNKECGFDKMFLDEYHRLRLQIYQE